MSRRNLYVGIFNSLVSLGTGYAAYYGFKSGNNSLFASSLGISIANAGFAYTNFQSYKIAKILDRYEQIIEEREKLLDDAIVAVDNAIHTIESEVVTNQIRQLGNAGLENIE